MIWLHLTFLQDLFVPPTRISSSCLKSDQKWTACRSSSLLLHLPFGTLSLNYALTMVTPLFHAYPILLNRHRITWFGLEGTLQSLHLKTKYTLKSLLLLTNVLMRFQCITKPTGSSAPSLFVLQPQVNYTNGVCSTSSHSCSSSGSSFSTCSLVWSSRTSINVARIKRRKNRLEEPHRTARSSRRNGKVCDTELDIKLAINSVQ